MDVKNILNKFELSTLPKYQIHIDKIDSAKTSEFVKAMVNKIIIKYGKEDVMTEILADNANSKISTHITHIIEVGGLKTISDNNLLVDDITEFKDMVISVVMILNCSIAQEFNNLDMFDKEVPNFYNIDAMIIIASRLANHALNGKKHEKGFEYYSKNMVFDNLLYELTDF